MNRSACGYDRITVSRLGSSEPMLMTGWRTGACMSTRGDHVQCGDDATRPDPGLLGDLHPGADSVSVARHDPGESRVRQ